MSGPVFLRLRTADIGTPAALLRALAAIGGEVMLRRDADGLGMGFAAPGRRKVRLDALLGSCAGHDGDWWLEAVAEVARLFPEAGPPWVMRVGEVRRLWLAGAIKRDAGEGRRARP